MIRSGTISVQVTSVSVPSRGLGADSGGSAPVWARVLVARSTEKWIDTATFSAEVGWREKEIKEGEEADAAAAATEDGGDTTPAPPFEFWPAPLPDLLPEEQGEGGDEVSKQEPSWAWTAVSHVTPDVIREAPADAASSVWEQTLATLSEDDIARAEMGYLYPQYNGAAPHRSGRIPLTRHHVTAVLNSSVVVEVYRGADRNVETDTLVGRASFGAETWDGERLVGGESSMARVLAYPGGVSVELPLEEAVTAAAAEPNDDGEVESAPAAFSEPATVGISVTADDALLGFCRGSRVFTCLVSGVAMCDESGAVATPEQWKIPCTAGEVKESDGSWESLTFSVACDLPNAEGPGPEVGKLTGGQPRSFRVPETSTDEGGEAVAGGEEEGASSSTPAATAAAAAAAAGLPTNVVDWSSAVGAPATLMRAFLPRDEAEALVRQGKALQDFPTGTPWSAMVTRSLFEGEESTPSEEEDGAATPPAGSSYQVPIPIVAALTEPGVAHIYSRYSLVDTTGAPTVKEQDPNAVEEEAEEGDVVRRGVSTVGPELMLYTQFSAPLVAAPPPPPEPVLMPSDLVAARPEAPRAPPVSAVKLLRNEVRAAATSIVSEIYGLFGSGGDDTSASSMTADQRRRQLLYHLNTGGAYHALREKLKHSMGRLVKERFPAEAALAPGSVEHGKFVGELYVFLMEEVFSVINDMFAEGSGGPTIDRDALIGSEKEESKSESDGNEEKKNDASELISNDADSLLVLARLGALAEEAELGGDLDLALRYHQDRVVASEGAAERRHVRQVDGGGATPWIDYAAFAARCGDYPKADECCREAIALSLPATAVSAQSGDADPNALLMQSALMSRSGDQEMAKVMLAPLITEGHPHASRGATMLSVLHLRCERETKKAEKAMKKAVAAGGEGCSRFDLYHDLAAWLVCRGLGDLSSFVLSVAAREGRTGTESADSTEDDATVAWTATNMEREQRVKHLWLGGATALAAGDLDRAEALLKSAIEVEEGCGEAWSVLGHVLARKNDNGTGAVNAFQTALPLLEEARRRSDGAPEPALPVAQLGQLYNSLGFLYLRPGTGHNASAAKEVYLRACRLLSTSTSWLGAGIAALELGKHQEAEDALAEANILNNQNPQIWIYLCLLCLSSSTPRVEEANQSLNQALRLGLNDLELLQKVGASYAALGCYKEAENCLRRSSASMAPGASRKLLGDVMAAQNKFEGALLEYEAVLSADTTPDVRKEATAGQQRMLEMLGGAKKAWPKD